jgi:hypothetical protein|tara:strand:- start:1318 stop:1491 length:174 start_codon:yes stop_codon:yes gene_type:complete
MPATYDADHSDQRHKGKDMPSKVKKSVPPVKKDVMADCAKRIGNSASEKKRMDYSVS